MIQKGKRYRSENTRAADKVGVRMKGKDEKKAPIKQRENVKKLQSIKTKW